MRSIPVALLVVHVCAAVGACGSSAPASDGAPGPTLCVFEAYEGVPNCNLALSQAGCGAVWKEGCTEGAPSTCVTMGNVKRTLSQGATCMSLGYTVQCNSDWVTQKYIASFPFGFTQACPKAGTPTPSTPDKCGKCGTFGSFGRCCGEPYCAGECIGSSCC